MSPLIGHPQQYTQVMRETPQGPLIIQVDVRQCEELYLHSCPFRIWAVAHMQAPDQEGMPMDAESEMLQTALVELIEQLPDDGSIYFLGTMMHQGSYVAIFHSHVDNIMGDPPATIIPSSRYDWYVYTQEDESYEFLKLKMVPTPTERRQLQDEEILGALADAGDQSIVPRPITFYGLFKREEDAVSAASDLDQQGYRTAPPSEMPGKSEFKWSLSFTRTAPTEPQVIEDVSATAHDICITYGGHYDGWSCEPVEG